MQRAAVTDAARSVGQRSVLHFPFHGKAVLRGGFLSIQACGFLQLPHPFGKVLSVSFFMRVSAFCCAGLCVLLRGPFVFSCAGQCLLLRWAVRLVTRVFRVLLRESVPSAARFRALSCAVLCILLRKPMAWQVWVAAVEMAWGWDCEAWGLRAGASRLAGSGKSTGALKKEAQQAGLTQPLRLLVRRDRDSNPGYSHPYAAFRVRSIRPLWHLSSSGSAALPVPCARGWWWRPWSNPFRSAKLLQPFHSNKHWSEKASSGQGVFVFRADGLCSLSRGFLSFRQGS